MQMRLQSWPTNSLGFADCPDGSDEKGCSSCSGPESLLCVPDQTCLLSTKRCDGIEDCSDGSDEALCTSEGTSPCCVFQTALCRLECAIHPKQMYMCESAAGRCFARDQLCGPYTRCPSPTKRDKLVCAVTTTSRPFF